VARYRWTILALGTGAQTAYSAVFLGIPVLAPALQKEYDLDLTQVGLAIAAANAGSVFTLLAWGLLADRVGERVVLAVGLAGCGAGLWSPPSPPRSRSSWSRWLSAAPRVRA